MDNYEELVFNNEFFTVIKKQYHADSVVVNYGSLNDYKRVTIVAKDDSRYWIYDKVGNALGGRFCENYGAKSFHAVSQTIIAVEFSTNCWRIITPDGKCLPTEYISQGDITSIGDYKDTYVEIHLLNGISTYLGLNGKYYFMNKSGEYLPVPDNYIGGMFLSEKACVLYNREKGLQLFDNGLRPIRWSHDTTVFFNSFEKTPLKWAIALRGNNSNNNIILNIETLSVFFLGWADIQSLTYKELAGNCLQITGHTRVENEKTDTWNKHYDEIVYYAIAFYNGRFITSTEGFKVLDNKRLIIKQEPKHSGCYSFDGHIVFNDIYDEICFDEVEKVFRLTYQGESIMANCNGNLQIPCKNGVVNLPESIVTYKKITENLFKVAQYQNTPNRLSVGSLKYGIIDISNLQYRVHCRYTALTYISDSTIIVCGNDNRSWGIIDIYGGQRMPMVFHGINQRVDGSFSFQTDWYSNKSFFTDSNLTQPVESEKEPVRIPAYYTIQPFYGKRDYQTEFYDHKKFHRDFCVVSFEGKYGLINKQGDEVIACAYNSLKCVYESKSELYFAAGSSQRTDLIEIFSGNDYFVKAESIEDCFTSADGAFFFLTSTTIKDKNGRRKCQGLYSPLNGTVIANEYARIWPVAHFNDFRLKTYSPSNLLALRKEGLDSFALAEFGGKLLTDFVFKDYHLDNNGLIVCSIDDRFNSEDKHIAVFDDHGRCIVPLEAGAEDYEMLSNDVIQIRCSESNCGYIFKHYSLDGTLLTNTAYSYIGTFIDGEAVVNVGGSSYISRDDNLNRIRYGICGGVFGVISSDYKTRIEPKYSLIRKNCNGLRVVSIENDKGHLYGVVTYDGKEIVACKYKYLGDACEGQLLFAENGEWDYRGPKREALYTADRYNRWLKGANWGIMDIDESVLVPASYQYIYRPIDGISIIVNDNRFGFYNYEEKMFFIPQYDFLEAFSEGLCVVGKKNSTTGDIRYGYLDKRNHIVIECVYLRAFHFRDGLAHVETEEAYCTINKGNLVVSSQNKVEIEQSKAEEAADQARAKAEEEDRRQMIEDGLREAFNGDASNMWNTD